MKRITIDVAEADVSAAVQALLRFATTLHVVDVESFPNLTPPTARRRKHRQKTRTLAGPVAAALRAALIIEFNGEIYVDRATFRSSMKTNGLNPNGMSATLSHIIHQGFAERDGRGGRITLTEKGKRYFDLNNPLEK